MKMRRASGQRRGDPNEIRILYNRLKLNNAPTSDYTKQQTSHIFTFYAPRIKLYSTPGSA